MYPHDCLSQGMSNMVVRADMTVTHLLTLKVGDSFEFGGAKVVSILDNLFGS